MFNIPTITRKQPPPAEEPETHVEQELASSKDMRLAQQLFEAGSVTPVGGPPAYPPPALPPGVPPPAPPPGMRSFGVPAQLAGTRPLRPPPVPSRNLPPGSGPPQPPPRPK